MYYTIQQQATLGSIFSCTPILPISSCFCYQQCHPSGRQFSPGLFQRPPNGLAASTFVPSSSFSKRHQKSGFPEVETEARGSSASHLPTASSHLTEKKIHTLCLAYVARASCSRLRTVLQLPSSFRGGVWLLLPRLRPFARTTPCV